MVDLFRAVGPRELDDILKNGIFRNPVGQEGKYFTSSAKEAAQYAREAVRAFGDDPYTIVRTQVPKNLLDAPTKIEKGINAFHLPTQSLSGLKPQVLTSSPIP